MVRFGAFEPVMELPLVVKPPSRSDTASPPAIETAAPLEVMVSAPCAVTVNTAAETELLWFDGSNVAVLDVSTGVMDCPAPPVAVRAIGVEAVGTVKLPVPEEVRATALPF